MSASKSKATISDSSLKLFNQILTSTKRLKPKEINMSITSSNQHPILATMRHLLVFLIFAIGCLAAATAPAQGPENTILVVNADSTDSLAVANLYISLRDIPAINVIYLSGLTTLNKKDFESTTSKRFLSQIWEPVSKTIKDRGLTGQVTCLTYSAGFPTRVNFQPQLRE